MQLGPGLVKCPTIHCQTSHGVVTALVYCHDWYLCSVWRHSSLSLVMDL